MKNVLNFYSFLLLLFFLFGCSLFSNAQKTKMLELEEAVSLGLNHSNNLKLDSLNLKIASSKLAQNKANQLPQVTASASYLRISDNITPFTVAFPTGNVVLNPQILNQSYNAVQARQLIWSGGKLRNANKIAALEQSAISYDLEQSKKEVSYQITSLYYNLYATQQTKKIIEANIDLLNNQKKDATNYVNEGILLENEILKIDLAVSNLETNLSDIENTISLFKNNLIILTGLNPNTIIEIPTDLPEIETNENTLENAITIAFKNRPELKSISTREKQAILANKINKSNYLPTLSGIGSYNYDQPNMRVFPNQETFTGTWYAGLSLLWNITDLFTNKNKVNESSYAIDKVTTTFNQVKEGIQMEVNADYNNYKLSLKKIDIASKSVLQATENFRVEQNKYTANSTTTTDFLNANALLVNAKISLATAIANSNLAYKKLLKSIN